MVLSSLFMSIWGFFSGKFYIPLQMLSILKYIALIGTFFIYTTSGVFSKLASQREFLSPGYIAFLACTVGMLGDGT